MYNIINKTHCQHLFLNFLIYILRTRFFSYLLVFSPFFSFSIFKIFPYFIIFALLTPDLFYDIVNISYKGVPI